MTAITILSKRADFVRLNRGRKFMADWFILRYAPRPEALTGEARVGYTVTTKCGNAVARNRIKRRLRALTRELGPDLVKPAMDYVFIARADVKPGAGDADYGALRDAVRRAFEAARA